MQNELSKMVELSDAELDAVAAGQVRQGDALVNVGAHLEDIEVDIPINIDVRNIRVGVAALGGTVIQAP